MKIEKINDNQIRCTLTPEDLKARDIRISELTYGSGKARTLFRDMMKEALNRCGFRLDNAPLMIEATPDSGGNLTDYYEGQKPGGDRLPVRSFYRGSVRGRLLLQQPGEGHAGSG